MYNKYPEIARNEFPDVLNDYLKKHMEVTDSLGLMINGLTKKANEIIDNEGYQEAFGKLNLALYKMLR